ncbi:MAG: DUF5652 family protein [Patescibacteria group bacterium]
MVNYLIQNTWAIVALVVWSLIWKGIALWKAVKNDSKPWFVALLIVNTVGLLEILYIFWLYKFGRHGKQV